MSLHCKDYTNYKEIILLQSKKIKDLEDKRGIVAYKGAAYKEYIKKLTEPDPCCPLCHRGFHSSKDASDLVKELRNDTTGHPDRLKDYEKDLAVHRKKYDALLQLQPVVDKIEQFEGCEIKRMRCICIGQKSRIFYRSAARHLSLIINRIIFFVIQIKQARYRRGNKKLAGSATEN